MLNALPHYSHNHEPVSTRQSPEVHLEVQTDNEHTHADCITSLFPWLWASVDDKISMYPRHILKYMQLWTRNHLC